MQSWPVPGEGQLRFDYIACKKVPIANYMLIAC